MIYNNNNKYFKFQRNHKWFIRIEIQFWGGIAEGSEGSVMQTSKKFYNK